VKESSDRHPHEPLLRCSARSERLLPARQRRAETPRERSQSALRTPGQSVRPTSSVLRWPSQNDGVRSDPASP
jgi:hypothetical protein